MQHIRVFLGAIALLFATTLFAAVNLNTASQGELAGLDGVGPTKAAAIVKYRKAHGPFKSVDDVTSVKGIGKATLDKNRSNLTVSKSKKPQKTKQSK